MNTNKIMIEKQQLEFLKKIQKDKIFENIQSIERYIELLKEQLRADSLDDFNINANITKIAAYTEYRYSYSDYAGNKTANRQ